MQQRVFLYSAMLVVGLELITLFHLQVVQSSKHVTDTRSSLVVMKPQRQVFDAPPQQEEPVPSAPVEELPRVMMLDVPYIHEAPENVWTGPWKNACEEAAIAMVEQYYQGAISTSISRAKAIMQMLFEEQNERWGTNANSDGEHMATLIETHASFHAQLSDNPTRDEIKAEIIAGRPVISLHRGFDLGNKNIPFLPTGSSYHTLVIVGFDDEAGEFITNDPGDTVAGAGRRYGYEVFMGSLHDYNYKTKQADGPARVIFTAPLKFVCICSVFSSLFLVLSC